MKSNKPAIILSVIFGIVAAAFIVLTVLNIVSPDKEKDEVPVINYNLSEGTELNALAKSTSRIITNAEKNVKYPDGILDSLKTAYAINNNLVGRLTIPGTEVDTVIVQSNDNSKYLTYNFYEKVTGEMSGTNYGNIFLDYRCSTDGSLSKNMVFHGHTTGKSDGIPKQGFRSLYDYADKQHFIDCPIIKYSTLYGEHTYKICAVFYSTTVGSSDNGYFFNYIYPDMSENNMKGYIEQVNQRALYKTGVSLEPTDNIITLSTCIYVYGKNVDTRLVVVGRLLHDGEDESIDASLVKDNPDYRRPQVWYNANKKTNPYKSSITWQPSPD